MSHAGTLSSVLLHGRDPVWLVRDHQRRETRVHYCTIPVSFLFRMDWILERTVHTGLAEASKSWRWIFLRSGLCRRCSFASWDARGFYPVAGDYARRIQSFRPGNQLRQDEIQTTVDSSVPHHVQVAGNTIYNSRLFSSSACSGCW